LRLSIQQAATDHWTHADQIRQTLLYNFLMASTILLLAWATVFAAAGNHSWRQCVLGLLSAAGAVLSLVWVAFGIRASGYAAMYEKTGLHAEKALPMPQIWPFHRRVSHRGTLKAQKGFEGLGRLAPSHLVIPGVPLLFFCVYAALFFISLA